MNGIKANILRCIKIATEEKGGIKRSQLLYSLQRGYLDVTDGQMRAIVREMVVEDGIPIGSSNTRGYFEIRTEQDYHDAVSELIGRTMSLNKRVNAIKKAYDKTLMVQPKMLQEDLI